MNSAGVEDRCSAPAVSDEQDETSRARGELEQVERELAAVRDRRRQIDVAEAHLWGRRNELERYLIDALGADWWHEHGSTSR